MDAWHLQTKRRSDKQTARSRKGPTQQGAVHRAEGKNGWHTKSPTAVGQVVRDIIELTVEQATQQQNLIELLRKHCDCELTKQIMLVSIRHGTLVVQVGTAEPAVLYHLRLRWEEPVVEVMRRHLPAAGIHMVRFTGPR